jgi:acetyl-CoA carboxylase biotin carboxyl carrier protein
MDFSQIKELLALIQQSNIGEFSLQEKGFSINVRTDKYIPTKLSTQSQAGTFQPNHQDIQVRTNTAPAAPNQPVALQPVVETSPAPQKEEAPVAPTAGTKTVEIRSPMVGTFYRSASPEKPPFVKIGDHISVESPLCLIEAMKLFNEVRSEISGRVVKILVENSSPVEYDQPLFLVEI